MITKKKHQKIFREFKDLCVILDICERQNYQSSIQSTHLRTKIRFAVENGYQPISGLLLITLIGFRIFLLLCTLCPYRSQKNFLLKSELSPYNLEDIKWGQSRTEETWRKVPLRVALKISIRKLEKYCPLLSTGILHFVSYKSIKSAMTKKWGLLRPILRVLFLISLSKEFLLQKHFLRFKIYISFQEHSSSSLKF